MSDLDEQEHAELKGRIDRARQSMKENGANDDDEEIDSDLADGNMGESDSEDGGDMSEMDTDEEELYQKLANGEITMSDIEAMEMDDSEDDDSEDEIDAGDKIVELKDDTPPATESKKRAVDTSEPIAAPVKKAKSDTVDNSADKKVGVPV